jgi:hypothetical protein
LTWPEPIKNRRKCFFSAKSFINRNKAVTDCFCNQYKYPALPMLFPKEERHRNAQFLQLKLTIWFRLLH